MKNLFTYLLTTFILTTGYTQQLETNLLPDSVTINKGREFTTDGAIVHAIVRNSNYYYLKIDNDAYEYITNVPYTMGSSKTIGLEIYDGDAYHLTKYEGVRIYKENGTWDSLTVNNGLKSGWTQGLLKDNDKLYVISKDTLNYFDGTSWNYFFLNTDNEYVKITKHNNNIYFNINDSGDADGQGIYVFDGTSLQLLIDEPWIYYYEIFEDQIWISKTINTEALAYGINGVLIDLDFGFPTNGYKSVMSSINDTLYWLENNKGFCIQNNQIIQIQEGLDYGYSSSEKLLNYKDGVLARTANELSYIKISEYNSFGSRQPNTNYRNLDVNQVDAYYMNRGQMFWDGISQASYEVPKGSGKHSAFAAGLWMSAKDQSDDIHVAVAKFNSNGHDYFPGPLRATGINKGTTDTTYATLFDYIWKISREEILLHQINYQSNGYVMPTDIETWPAHGNVSDGYAENLAPFIDTDNNGIYEPENGDYPDIKGDMSLYWIFNDNLDTHTESQGGTAFGAEIHAEAYAYSCDTITGQDSVINYTTFLNYRIINRSDTNYHDFTSAFWTDADLGNPSDDYIGTNVELNTMYFYNGDDMDGDGTGNSYGANPPAQFITILDAPLAVENDGVDNDNDGSIDEAGEKSLLKNMMYFNNNSGNQGDPTLSQQFYNYMNNIWKDGRPLTFGGTGYIPNTGAGTPTKYMFPGESDPWNNGTDGVDPNYPATGGWTEVNEANAPDDRRGVASCGSFDFNSGDELEFTTAMVWSRGENGAFSSVTKGFTDVARIIELYKDNELQGCGLENVSVPEGKTISSFEIYPNPTKEQFVVKGIDENSKYQIIDIKGQLVKQGENVKAAISIKNLDSGTYIVRVISNNTASTQKLIIK